MKKSLIALAVLAASGAAMAQSSVTLYGIADVWVGSIDTDTGVAATSTKTTSMVSGGVSTSRWGMKGSEDLGGGLKANFQLESAVSVDTGASSGFDRQAWVGVSGGFGDVRFGRNSTPYDDYAAGSHGAFDSDLAPMNLGGYPSTKIIGKSPNTIKYVSPSMAGFNGAVSYALDEEKAYDATSKEGAAVTSLGLNYKAGAFGAQLVYQEEEKYLAPYDSTFIKAGASFDFGMATVKGYIAQTSDLTALGNDADEWQIAVDFPLSTALTLSASYAEADFDAYTAVAAKKSSGYGIALAYSLSKRTTIYGGYGAVTTDYADTTPDLDVTALAIGIKHTF